MHVHTGMARTAIGFIVSRAVGPAVTRHRVTRQLRHLMRDRSAALPPGTGVVVRAMPAAAGRTSADLGRCLDAALGRALDRPAAGAIGRGEPGPDDGARIVGRVEDRTS